MKKPKQKRVKVDKHGTHWPQYKLWFFWLHYRRPTGKKAKERFCDMWSANQFLRAKHNQDLAAIKCHANKGIVNWSPKE